jgi:hypothetical protein
MILCRVQHESPVTLKSINTVIDGRCDADILELLLKVRICSLPFSWPAFSSRLGCNPTVKAYECHTPSQMHPSLMERLVPCK